MRIFDCFMFNGEIDILLLRLHRLQSAVDIFVIVEATRTFDGNAKPLQLRARWRDVQPFAQKIRYVVVDETAENAAARETLQRNAISRALIDAAEEDCVILSCIREVPCAEIIRRLAGAPQGCYRLRLAAPDRGKAAQPNTTGASCCMAPVRLLTHRTPEQLRVDVQSGTIHAVDIDAAGWLLAADCKAPTLLASVPPEVPLPAAHSYGEHQGSRYCDAPPIIVCPYVFDEDRVRATQAFSLEHASGKHLPFFFWKDKHLIGPERAYQHCWNQFPDRDVIIVHTDMRPMPDDIRNDWYHRLCGQVAKLPDAGLIGCDLLYPLQSPSGRWYAQCAGGYFQNGAVRHFGGGVSLAEGVATAHAYEYDDRFAATRASQWVTFGGVYIRRETIDMIGDFDTRYLWAYVMDVDYCLEATIRGQCIYQVPVNLLHEESTTSKKFLGQPEYLAKAEGNMHKFLEKWDWYLSRLDDN